MRQHGIHGANADPFENVHIGSKQNYMYLQRPHQIEYCFKMKCSITSTPNVLVRVEAETYRASDEGNRSSNIYYSNPEDESR